MTIGDTIICLINRRNEPVVIERIDRETYICPVLICRFTGEASEALRGTTVAFFEGGVHHNKDIQPQRRLKFELTD